ncbi:MAG: hypothetical protein ACR2NZ_19845 [Rubripirellula sp.]
MLSTVVVGVGSPHGDDMAGWHVVDRLREFGSTKTGLKKAATPHDLLDWLAGVSHLHVVDACENSFGVQSVDLSAMDELDSGKMLIRWHVDRTTTRESIGVIPSTHSLCSHQLGLPEVIRLAKALDRLPPRVTLWAVAGENFSPGCNTSETSRQAVELATHLIRRAVSL